MLNLLKKIGIAVVTASLFIATTIMGVIAGAVGAIVRAQLPDENDPGAEPQNSTVQAPASPKGAHVKRIPSQGTR